MQADKTKVTRLLKTARGQLDGILKMVEEDRYCIDISNQLMATQAIITRSNSQILHAHIKGCVLSSIGSENCEEKLNELSSVLDKLLK